MKQITAALLALILTINTTIGVGYAQEAPPTPTTPPVPETPTTPENPYVPTPAPTTQPTEAPAATPQPTPEPTRHPKAATPKPAATAQTASTPQPAATAVPPVTQQTQPSSTPTSAINGQPDYANTTGGQAALSQTGNGSVQTGDATVTANVGNDVNTNLLNSGSGAGGSNGSVGNAQNGDSSTNNATSDSNNSSDTTLSNLADIDNNIALAAKTGDNTASRNTGDGTVLTGDANVGVTVINGGNNNVQGLAVNQYDVNNNQSGDIILGYSAPTASCGTVNVCQSGILGADVKNTGNGTDSTNNAKANSNATNDVAQTNAADVTNNVAVDAITGQNHADSNVGAGHIETGDANVAVTILNFLNNNILAGVVDVINIFDDYSGDVIIPKAQTTAQSGPAGNHAAGNNAAGNHVSNNGNGDSSTNNAAQNSSLEKNIAQTNVSDIDNNINITANTGENRTASNTNGSNSVETGDVNAHAQVYNLANINSTDGGYVVLINDKGTWRGKVLGADGSEQMQFEVQPDGSVVATNNGNGTGSENNATSNAQASETVTQTNNANLSNNVNINADTGNNSASRNTGGGSVSTGDVNVGASIMNFVNNNFVGQTFRVLLVNVFGNWTGQVRKEGEPKTTAQQPQPQVNTPAIGGATVTQDTTDEQTSMNQNTSGDSNANQQIANVQRPKASSQVLGTMTKRNDSEGFSINLADGRTYFTDDTVQVPESAPLVASIVEKNDQDSGFNYLWLLSLGLLPAGYLGYKKYQQTKV